MGMAPEYRILSPAAEMDAMMAPGDAGLCVILPKGIPEVCGKSDAWV
jgi:hypothetical protein